MGSIVRTIGVDQARGGNYMTSNQKKEERKLPIAKNEQVEFSSEAADVDDIEAVIRADEADNRQENS
ncbi:YfhD-like protein [Paenibacillus sp. GP183]|nr:YfhD-like protein [Paenibacillus sp. GP183]